MHPHILMFPQQCHPHFLERQAQRCLRTNVLEFILTFGTETRARGATHVTIVERTLPPALRRSWLADLARGWVVLLDDRGRLRTCYRRRDAVRYLRRKPKRRL